jgi:ATP-binding cassette subfamily B protein
MEGAAVESAVLDSAALAEGIAPRPASTMRERVRVLIGDRRGTVLALAICSMLTAFTESGILILLAQIAATAAKGGSHVRSATPLVHVHAATGTLFLIAFALTIARVGMQVPLSFLPARIAADVQARMRVEVFGAYSRASWEVQSKDREGHLQETMTSQVLQATTGALQATTLVIASFQFVVLMGFAVALNAVAAGIILVAAVILFGALRPLNVLGQRRAKELSLAQLEYAGGISETSRLAEETQVFGVGREQRAQVGGLIANSRRLFHSAQVIGRLSPAVYQSAIYLMLVAGLYALYSQGAAHFASLGAVVLLIIRAGTFGQQVQGAYQGLRQSLPFIERLQDAKRRYADSAPAEGTVALPAVQSIAFEGVSFAYRSGRPILKDISFRIDAGEAVGIIGPSGAGKSTLIQILLQLRSPDVGRYLVNGTPVERFLRDDWHRRVAYVPQQPRLLHASVAANIRYFRQLDDEAVERAGRLARIHEEIVSWPDGYDTIVGPRMDAVSGGQQQRICLARALAARPEVLVLDEPTSALDPHSETLIQDSLAGLRQELTLFIIAHRISTLDICDRVMVIIDGSLEAFDTIDLLRRTNSYYRSASTLATGAAGGALP